jgi:hypothetical protein
MTLRLGRDGGEDGRGGGGFAEARAADHEEGEQDRNTIFFLLTFFFPKPPDGPGRIVWWLVHCALDARDALHVDCSL